MMEFNYKGFLEFISQNNLPNNFFKKIPIDRKKYSELSRLHTDSGIPLKNAFLELSKRVGEEYYRKVYPTQSAVLNYSERVFPAYRFLLPEVLADDWLAIVDWHKKHSRDHALHQPLSAYIIYQLLGGGDSKKSFKIGEDNLLDLCVSKILNWDKTHYIKEYLIESGVDSESKLLQRENRYTFSFWKSLFFETAIVAAIFHDIGYPWQYIGRLNNCLKTADFYLENSLTNAEYVYKNFENRLILYPFNGYKKINNNTPCNWNANVVDLISESLSSTHGFPGAVSFLYLNDMTREYPSRDKLPFHNFCVDWAALGIMMHDMRRIYEGRQKDSIPNNKQIRVEFDRDPLSCLIVLADTLQEFERPNIEFKNYKDLSQFFYNHSCVESQMNLINGVLTIEYKYKDRAGAAIKRVFVNKEILELFEPDHGYVDLSSIGINEVKMIATF